MRALPLNGNRHRRNSWVFDIMTTPRALRLDPSDNVVIAIDEIASGAAPTGGVAARERIPKGHKATST